jgi:hypothetical protein
MAFKGFKKTEAVATSNHFEEVEKNERSNVQTIGRPIVDEYKKQNQRVQFYISQEMIDTLTPIAYRNGCKDVTAYAKKMLVEAFEQFKKD